MADVPSARSGPSVRALLADALLAIGAGDRNQAVALVQAGETESATETESELAEALARFLRSDQSGSDDTVGSGVYVEPSAFEDFINHGDNPNLYAATIEALTTIHDDLAPTTVLDVGCGDGRVTAATVAGSGKKLIDLDLVEPSAVLLDAALARLAEAGVAADANQMGIGPFLDQVQELARWDLVQATFALHSLRPHERVDVLERLAPRTGRLAMVEFDVPAFDDRSAALAAYVVERYEVGLRQYGDHPNVIDGFLIPVLVGQFDPAQPRHTFEQPIDTWCHQLEAAGWSQIDRRPVASYWWADAYLIEAAGRG